MNNIIKYHESFISYIKSVILKYCPYTDDRLSILDNTNPPELDIIINIFNAESQIMFLFGNNSSKLSIPERALTSHTASFEEICGIIDYLLEDHEMIKNIAFDNKKIDLKFSINWTEKSIKGINCNDIGLKLTFDNMELEKQYLLLLFQRYYDNLERVSSFRLMKDEYINSIKYSYFNTLDKTKLIALLKEMNEFELRELLYGLDNNIFIKYVINEDEQSKVKALSLKDKKNN